MSSIALVIIGTIIANGPAGSDSVQDERHIYWADPTAKDPMRSTSTLVGSWYSSFNVYGLKSDNNRTHGMDKIPVSSMAECEAYGDKLLYMLKTGYETSSLAVYKDARCVYIPDGFVLRYYSDTIGHDDNGNFVFHEDPYALKKLPTPQELAKKKWDEDHPDCLNANVIYPVDEKEDDLIEAEGNVDIKCLFSQGSDKKYHASQCEVVNVTLDKSYKKKLEYLYKKEFSDSALDYMGRMCILLPPEQYTQDGKTIWHISYSQED